MLALLGERDVTVDANDVTEAIRLGSPSPILSVATNTHDSRCLFGAQCDDKVSTHDHFSP